MTDSSAADTVNHDEEVAGTTAPLAVAALCMFWVAPRKRYDGQVFAADRHYARLDRTLADLRAGTAPSDLPERVSFFGYTRMPAAMLDLLEALGQVCDVHVWLPHPSPALWAALAENRQGIVARRDDASAEAAAHPLLATLGRDIREVEAALLARCVVDATDSGGGESRDASRATPTPKPRRNAAGSCVAPMTWLSPCSRGTRAGRP